MTFAYFKGLGHRPEGRFIAVHTGMDGNWNSCTLFLVEVKDLETKVESGKQNNEAVDDVHHWMRPGSTIITRRKSALISKQNQTMKVGNLLN